MKKVYLLAAVAMMATQLQAQRVVLDTYVGAQLATEDLNGTARYVGMGGAMEALGADLSTMSTNPAGIGLFRRSQVAGSFGLVSQSEGKSFQDGSKTNASFDQLGIVFSTRTGMHSYVNFGVNFHKNRNFNHVLSAAARSIDGSSQNRQTCIKGIRGDLDTQYGESQVDNLYDKMIVKDGTMFTYDSEGYQFDRAQTGYIGEYDFNISGNINNRVYLGVTVGLKDVHYNSYTEYSEKLLPQIDDDVTYVGMRDDHKITGHGFEVKVGAIVRPVEESPFRLGVSVSTPTFYKLTTSNVSSIHDVKGIQKEVRSDADFRFYTPWKFGLSLGHTVGNYLALGASYEYADYSTNDMRTISGSGYDWDGYYYERSSTDTEMKRHTERTLKGVSTLKLGAEYKVDPMISVRVGYNYVSPMYKESGVRDQTLQSSGTYMASTTDYTNWKATNRLTAGVGFAFNQFKIDLAYQYSMRSGDFYPYMNGVSAQYIENDTGKEVTLSNQASAVSVKDNRHQLLCTLSYSF